NSPYLHFGYWEPIPTSAEELTFAGLRTAQEAYCKHLLSYIPTGTKTVLDVGCGIGGNAAYLLAHGFAVEGLAPDTFQQSLFLQHTHGQAPFHLSRFEDFHSPHSYELILFSESSQYLAADDLAKGAARLLHRGGYLLLADMLRVDAGYSSGIFSNCLVVSELHTALVRAGFHMVATEDISKQIVPTIELGVYLFRTFGLSTINYISKLAAITIPPLPALTRYLFGRPVKQLIAEGLDARTIFERHLCYQIQLWQLSDNQKLDD
ncbi:MAG: methyltransferase domain-containing protein, partial [Chroococcidiopsidaceae cyanobacterium CP_BM_RX_35]|nr:methyltransferase domain-containing protein [Chroococcidiopsidaceae cyanobacterium CP_BM_RX_35]